jgi:hypothetical protein
MLVAVLAMTLLVATPAAAQTVHVFPSGHIQVDNDEVEVDVFPSGHIQVDDDVEVDVFPSGHIQVESD